MSLLRKQSSKRKRRTAGELHPGKWLNQHEHRFGEKISQIFNDIDGIIDMHLDDKRKYGDQACVEMALAIHLYCLDASKDPKNLADMLAYRNSFLEYHGMKDKTA